MNSDKQLDLKNIINMALLEDIGILDITTAEVIPDKKRIKAFIMAKEDCIVCGMSIAKTVFATYDNKINFKILFTDGRFAKKGSILARLEGKAASILAAERVALNFLGMLSGIATMTRKYVSRVRPYKAKIMDTRKTIPCLRELEKYAVRIGGGYNHRFSLDEMIMIKDNHLKIIGGHNNIPKGISRHKSEIEVEDIKGLKIALKLNPDIIMLDNMSIGETKKAVKIRDSFCLKNKKSIKLEASGGITIKNIRRVAAAGVEMISVGALTHSFKSADISLEIP